ncbi:uncharacterized protein METZ01_LOCUS186367 [marine metagenome]|uniref:Uncharacterized protein n=1 Tax=marine metagenome TaxID=408172 RepID=A0A382D7E6_9ZZZZ
MEQFLFLLVVVTTLLFPNERVETFVNKFEYTTLDECAKAQFHIEVDRGQPSNGVFRVSHIGICVKVPL